jgi:recombinational DNA repair protein (RecF pathway)
MGDLTRCVVCGGGIASGRVRFSSRLGGLVCGACEASAPDKLRVDAAALAGLGALAAAAGGAKVSLPEPQARGVNRMLSYHAEQQLGKALRTRRYAVG